MSKQEQELAEQPELGTEEENPSKSGKEEKSDTGAAQDLGDKKGQEKKEDPEPPTESPRFREIYGKMRRLEREKEEHQKDLDAIRAVNNRLMEKVTEIEQTKANKVPPKAPDPETDPVAFEAFQEQQRNQLREQDRQSRDAERVGVLIAVESGLHEDYDDMVALAQREMDRDPALKKSIYSQPNPPRAAYQLGLKKAKERKELDMDEKERKERIAAAAPEGGGDAPPPAAPSNEVSKEELRVIAKLFPDLPPAEAKKKYLQQKQFIGGRR